MFQSDPRLFKKKQVGDPISAREWNALVDRASREVTGPNVLADDRGWAIGERPTPKLHRLGMVVCEGPEGEPSSMNEM